MSRLRLTALIACGALALSACGASDDAPRPPPPAPKDTVFGDMIDAKERAKRETEQAAQAHQEQLKAAEKKAEE